MRLNHRPPHPRPDPRPRDVTDVHHHNVTAAVTAPRRWVRWRRVLVISALIALAAVLSLSDSADAAQVLAQAASVEAVLSNVRNWLMGILAGLATVFATIGGIRYVMANGDPGEIDKAKTAFRGAGKGYAMALLAPLAITILQSILGA